MNFNQRQNDTDTNYWCFKVDAGKGQQIIELRHQECGTDKVPFVLGLEGQGTFQGRRAFQEEDILDPNGLHQP